MTTDAPLDDLTMTGFARRVARQAREMELETMDPNNPFRNGIRRDRDLAAMVALLADIVTELAATHDRIGREDDLR